MTGESRPSARFAQVLIPVAVDAPYSYRVPEGMTVQAGDVVTVPLGKREAFGCVWAVSDDAGEIGHNRLKDITRREDVPPLPDRLRRLVTWVADYTVAPLGMVLRMALRDPEQTEPARPRVGVRLGESRPQRMTPARTRLLAVLEDGLARGKAEAAREAGVSVAVIDTLVDEGVLEAIALPPASIAPRLNPDHAHVALSPAQSEAAEVLRAAVNARAFAPIVLDGVTGSGKTEVYCEAIAACIAQGRQALLLLPEIALTGQVLDRITARFGAMPVAWHSGISGSKRARSYLSVASGEAQLVVGARSALFLPFRDLGLIIVDEEHEAAYRQEDGVHYHARDMAVVRAQIEAAPVILASATPSIETRVNADQGRYRRIVLPERFGGRMMPATQAIDMRLYKMPPGRWISPPLHQAVAATVEAGEQALLFLNRRGYAPLTLCRTCGERIQCPHCSAWLVEHRFRRRLVCHHCGFSRPPFDACPKCEAVDSMVACGPGVERLAEECAERFPGKRLLILSSDMAGGIVRLRQEIEAVARGEADIIIGTQLVAKGHNFPNLALVGVIDADIALAHGDPRAGERTFQVLQQVVGRAGRARDGSRAFLQTHLPDHPVIDAIVRNDREGFYAAEIAMREAARLPPFGRLAAIVISAADAPSALAYARRLAQAAPNDPELQVLGPAEAPFALLRGRHRFRLLARSARRYDLSRAVRDWLRTVEAPRGSVQISVDIDPLSFL